MAQHIIVAVNIEPKQFQYFFGYGRNYDHCNILWTSNPWNARIFDDDEVSVELNLLSLFCPNFTLDSLRHA
jgi:hypothetical protein